MENSIFRFSSFRQGRQCCADVWGKHLTVYVCEYDFHMILEILEIWATGVKVFGRTVETCKRSRHMVKTQYLHAPVDTIYFSAVYFLSISTSARV